MNERVRSANSAQLITDGHRDYLTAVEKAFENDQVGDSTNGYSTFSARTLSGIYAYSNTSLNK